MWICAKILFLFFSISSKPVDFVRLSSHLPPWRYSSTADDEVQRTRWGCVCVMLLLCDVTFMFRCTTSLVVRSANEATTNRWKLGIESTSILIETSQAIFSMLIRRYFKDCEVCWILMNYVYSKRKYVEIEIAAFDWVYVRNAELNTHVSFRW